MTPQVANTLCMKRAWSAVWLETPHMTRLELLIAPPPPTTHGSLLLTESTKERKTSLSRAGEVAKLLRCLLYKHKKLSSVPRNRVFKKARWIGRGQSLKPNQRGLS